jgi:general secretion pathway protein L
MLIIHLAPLHSTTFEFVVSADGLGVSGSGQATASQLPPSSGEVVAVLPWQVLSWHTVNLPPGVGQRSNTVLESLLEEQLLQDPQDMHLVLSPASGKALRQGGPVLVLACAKAWLRQALAPLQAAGVRVQRLVPELQTSDAPALHLLNDNGQLQALLCQADTLWRLPPQAAAAASVAPIDHATVWAEPSVAEHANRWSEQPAQLQTAQQRWLQAATSEWNLAQGEWAQNSRLRGQRWLQQAWRSLWHGPEWHSARRGLLGLVLVQLVGLNAWAWREQTALSQQQAALTHIFKDSFPKVTVVVDAPLQMQREVQALQQGAGLPQAADLDAMLQTLSAHWPDHTPPAKLDYRLGELRLTDVPANTLQTLSQVPWPELGYQFKQDGAQAVLRTEAKP